MSSYKEMSTKYPSMINSFAHPFSTKEKKDNLTKLLTVLPELGKNTSTN